MNAEHLKLICESIDNYYIPKVPIFVRLLDDTNIDTEKFRKGTVFRVVALYLDKDYAEFLIDTGRPHCGHDGGSVFVEHINKKREQHYWWLDITNVELINYKRL